MLDEIFLLITNCVSSALFWFLDFLDAIPGSVTLITTAFLIATAVRLLIAPLVGAASSDLARSNLKSIKGNNKTVNNKSKNNSNKKG